MNRQDFNQMMKDSFGDKVVNIPSKTDNELIAEFMGASFNDKGMTRICGKFGLERVSALNLKYHTSWDWLMPVTEKISDIKGWSLNSTLEWLSESQDRDGLYDIEGIFQAVVEFIKKHNDTVGDTNTMNSINITFGTKLTKDKFTSAMQRSIHHLDGVSWKVNSSKTIDKRAIVLKAIVNRYEGLANLIPQLQEDSDVAYVNIADDIDDILNENQIEEIINELITQNYEKHGRI